jgi:hypothetical protein
MVGKTEPEVWRTHAAASSADDVARAFDRFGRVECAGYSRFYSELSVRTATEPRLVDLCVLRLPGQPAPNLLFAAVRHLLARKPDEPLALHYARAAREGAAASGADAWEEFRDFALANADEVRRLVSTRRVQTNEPARAAPLALGLAAALAPFPGKSAALVELGTSAGLLLVLDRYALDYRMPDARVVRRGPASSAVHVVCEVKGPVETSLLAAPIPVASRTGIDLHPVDVDDEDAVGWLRALVWPERPERERRLAAAAEIARGVGSSLVAGNAADLLPDVLTRLPDDVVACVVHSSFWHQVGDSDRRRIDEAIGAHAGRRPLVRVSLESRDGAVNDLRLGLSQERLIARAHPHGLAVELLG